MKTIAVLVLFVSAVCGQVPSTRTVIPSDRVSQLEAEVAQLRAELNQLRQVLADAGVIRIHAEGEPPRDLSSGLSEGERQMTRSTTQSVFDEPEKKTSPSQKTPAKRKPSR